MDETRLINNINKCGFDTFLCIAINKIISNLGDSHFDCKDLDNLTQQAIDDLGEYTQGLMDSYDALSEAKKAIEEELTRSWEEYNEKLEDEENLKDEINKLQDPEYMAKYAREKYLYSKNGEIIIKIEDQKGNNGRSN